MEESFKTLSLRLLENGTVRIYAPHGMTKEEKIHLLQEALKYLLSI